MFATGSQDKTVTVWKRNFDTINIVLDDDENETENLNESTLQNYDAEVEDDYGRANDDLEVASVDFRSQDQLYNNYMYADRRTR